MRMLKQTRLLPLILLLLWAINCVPKPPDVPVCEDLSIFFTIDADTGHELLHGSPACVANINENQCGHCTYIVSGKEIYVGEQKAHQFNGKPWSQVKRESIYVPAAESYAPIQAYIINSCKRLNCDKQVDAFKVKLDSLNGIGAALKNQ